MMFDYADFTKNFVCSISPLDASILYNSAMLIEPKVLVEIGVDTSLTSLILGDVARKCSGHLYSIEPNLPDVWRAEINRLGLNESVTAIEVEPPWLLPEQMGKIPKPIDYMYFGGNYLTKQYIANYQFWQKYVRRNGRVVFNHWLWHHDIVNHVPRALNIILERDRLVKIGAHRDIIVFDKEFD